MNVRWQNELARSCRLAGLVLGGVLVYTGQGSGAMGGELLDTLCRDGRVHISMLRNKVHYIIPHMLSETRPTGERYRKVVVFGYGVFPSLPSLLCSPLSCCQRETEREREGEHVGDFLYFQAFFGGFNINIGDWRYLMLEREVTKTVH